MATFVGGVSEYRSLMQIANSSHRAHAICRRLVACVNPRREKWRDRGGRSLSAWYGAHYWAACWLLEPEEARAFTDGRRRFLVELTGGDNHRELPVWALSLWKLACARVNRVLAEAKALPNSNLW